MWYSVDMKKLGRKPKNRAGKSEGTRICSSCKRDIRIEDFYKDRTRRDGLSAYCKTCGALRHRDWWQRKTGKRYSKEYRSVASTTSRRKLRKEVLDYYGGKCACCGETTYEFLCIDHVENNGGAFRRSQPSNTTVTWLRKNGLPPGHRVLCYNCNAARQYHKVCPHQRGKLKIDVTAASISPESGEVEISPSPSRTPA